MNKWPHTIPQDLAQALENLDGMRFNASDADRWGVIRDWLVKHSVAAPEYRLPKSQEITWQD